MKLWKRGIFAAVVLVGYFCTPAGAATREVNLRFTVMQWINAVDIFAGKQIIARGEDKDVLDYARGLVDRHTQWAKELLIFAQKNEISGVNIREESGNETVAELLKAIVAAGKLKQFSGKALDKAFIALMIKVHALSLSNLAQAESSFGSSEEGKFLMAHAPQIREWQTRANKLAEKFRSDLE